MGRTGCPAAIARGSGSFQSPTRRTYGLVVNCEYVSEIDPAVLRVLFEGHAGLGGGYSWVTCGACDAGWQVADYAESVG
jgi:hypothetical protein